MVSEEQVRDLVANRAQLHGHRFDDLRVNYNRANDVYVVEHGSVESVISSHLVNDAVSGGRDGLFELDRLLKIRTVK